MEIKLDFKGKRYEGGKTLDALLKAYVDYKRDDAPTDAKPTRGDVISELVEAGLRRRAAVAREQARKYGSASWAGVSDASAPAPDRDGKGKHKAKGSKPAKKASKPKAKKASKPRAKKAEGVTTATNPGAA